ncbi:MAG: glycoside hydrolase family 88 protein [Treponema sp.]|nr:glycoside hydrolase family 88 protein [Treponema sp.]
MAEIDEAYGKWAEGLSEKILAKMECVVERNRNRIPCAAKDGAWNDCSKDNIGRWSNGFWAGINWQLYNVSKKPLFMESARFTEKALDRCFLDYGFMDQNSGFRWLPSSYASYALTKDKDSYNRLRLAADNLVGRFNSIGNFIRAWNEDGKKSRAGWASIDGLMNLPLLYWASRATGDMRYYAVATKYTDTVLSHFIREDGSAIHIAEFDPKTGDFIAPKAGCGMDENSCWTKGHAWALYGLTLSYLHTKEDFYLDGAQHVATSFLSRIPDNLLVPVDFCQGEDCKWEDSSASAIAACALIELSGLDCQYADAFFLAGVKMLESLVKNRLCLDKDRDELLENCSASYHDKSQGIPLVYGDYFFIEALWKLMGKDVKIWGGGYGGKM